MVPENASGCSARPTANSLSLPDRVIESHDRRVITAATRRGHSNSFSSRRSREAACLAWAQVPDLDEPADGVGERLAQWSRLESELVSGFRVVAVGGAVHDPDPLALPRQARL